MTTKPQAQLCGCLLDALPGGELQSLLNHPQLDLVEWRLDVFIARHGVDQTRAWLKVLANPARHPVVVTNRPERHGGFFAGSEDQRLEVLRDAVRQGAEWVDLESDLSREAYAWFRDQRVKTLISHHDFERTPERAILQRVARDLAAKGAGAIKIATLAQETEDALGLLELIPWGRRELGMEVIAFAMGPLGRWSRVASLLLGSPWTYVKFAEQAEAAPGQYTAVELRMLWEMLA
jgi:3-dehydroquinate dehydratase I